MPAAATHWTVEMLDALPDDGNRYELIDGELFVTPAPSDVHQLIVGALHSRLRSYLRPAMVARVLVSPADVRRDDRRRNRVQPDIFVVRLVEGKRPAYPFELSDLLLAIEVVSPGHAGYDFQTKRSLYMQARVPEYWILDPDARTLACWRPEHDAAELLATHVEWQPPGMLAPFAMDLPEFFDDALG